MTQSNNTISPDVGQGPAPEAPPRISVQVDSQSVECIKVEVTQDCAKVLVDGMEKLISHEALLSMLTTALSAVQGAAEELFLPSNVFYFARTVTGLQLNLYFPGGVKPIIYHSTRRMSVVPNIILSIPLEKDSSLGSYKVVSSQVKYFCTDLPVSRLPKRFINSIDWSSRIFLLPFSNTYEAGHMCTGGNTMPTRFQGGNLRGLDWYYNYMFESPFNDDLGVSAVSGHSSNTWYSILADLASKEQPFPYEKLRGWKPIEAAATPVPSILTPA